MRNVNPIIIGSILILALLMAGCVNQQQTDDQQQDDIDTSIDAGTLKLKITDKPSELNITHAKVMISKVQVHKANVTIDEEELENIDDFNDSFIADGNGPYDSEIGKNIYFNGTAAGGIEPYNYTWDFGDGTILYGQNVTYNYTNNGTYTVNLTVKDNDSTSKIDWYLTTAMIGEIEGNDDASTVGWYTIVEESQEFDLIELREKNVSEILGENTLSLGKYTQIRLTFEKANITIINETGDPEVHEMKIPSNTVKLVKAFWIHENETTELTLDFDINESVHQTGNNKFIMRPTIKIIEN